MRAPKSILDRLRWRLATMHDEIRETRDEARAGRAQAEARLAAAEERGERLEAALGRLEAENKEARARWEADRAHLIEVLKATAADEAAQRRRLYAARATPAYELAYTDADPLVTVIMPTYDNHAHMRDRAIPSVLAQTHANLELLVVGDDAPPEAEEAALGSGDPRVRYWNRPLRGPYPQDPMQRWHVAGSLPFNEAMSQARGRWIAPFADDDAMRPDHLRLLLEAARRDRLELVYGRFTVNFPDRPPETYGEFPPRHGRITLQAALHHADLRLFETELTDSLFDQPIDWARVERMLRAGVRCGMIDDVVVDVYPSRWWNTRGVPHGDEG